MKQGSKLISKILIFLFILVVVSCSPRLNRNFLAFFFDGVPVNDSIKSKNLEDNSNEEISDKDIFRAVPVELGKEYTIHYPYREKECSSCHDENSKIDLIMDQPDLCYICHEDYSQKYNYVHGPVAGGYCTTCHNPHYSKGKSLLIMEGQQLCLFCHVSKTVLSNEVHNDIADTECILCHNPHGGEDNTIQN